MRPDELLPAHLAGRLRPWSGNEEDYVRATRAENAAVVCNTLLARCFGDAAEIDALLVHDRDLALVALRWVTSGPALPLAVTCSTCDSQHDVTIDLDRLSRPADPPALVTVVGDGLEVVVGLPTAGDQAQIVSEDDEDLEHRRSRLLARCTRSIGRALGPFSLDDIRALPPSIRDQIERALEGAIPDVDLELVLSCPACGESIEAAVQLAHIVLAELRERSRHLLREVHALARTYHWSEREILALTSVRRREYLALIDAEQTSALLAEALE